MKIIGLTGRAGSGKSLAAELIAQEARDVEIRAFAEPLKRSAAALLGIAREDVDRLKNNPRAEVWLTLGNACSRRHSFRAFLQRYGTEAHREVFGEAFWLEATLPVHEERSGLVVVTDVRFPNEARHIIALGGEVWRILRPGRTLDDDEAAHPSELPVSAELVARSILNDGTIADLRREIAWALGVAGVPA